MILYLLNIISENKKKVSNETIPHVKHIEPDDINAANRIFNIIARKVE